MTTLPPIADVAQLKRLRANEAHWLPAAQQIVRAEGYDGAQLVPFGAGTNLVAALNDQLVLKIFPSFHRAKFLSERATLRVLGGRVGDVATPELLHHGECEGWSYLIMSRLEGVAASEVWPLLAEADKPRLLRQLGRLIADVQQVSPGELLTLGPRWSDFLQMQLAGCRARHQRLGLPPALLAVLDDLLNKAVDELPRDPQSVILTGEYIPENFMLSPVGDGWRVSGLFDFGDVMTGFGEYDLLGPSAFLAAGHAARMRALFEGYGLAPGQVTWQLKRRLLFLMLLHQASDPLRHIAIPDWPLRAGTFDALQALIWPE